MPQRVLILRPDHLGDLILFTGALEPIRARWPVAEITLCAPDYARSFLEHCPFIDRFVPFKQLEMDALCQGEYSWMPAIRGMGRVARVIRTIRQPFRRDEYVSDVVLFPLRTPLEIYHRILSFIPAAAKFGIDASGRQTGGQPPETVAAVYTERMSARHLPPDFPELEINRKFLEFLGCDLRGRDLWPQFWTTAEDAEFARQNVPAVSGAVTIRLAPGVPTRTEKQLSPDWYRHLFQDLAGVPCRLIAFGTGTEQAYCESVLQKLADLPQVLSVRNLAGLTTARQLVESVRLCDVWLSQETAALHLAVALRKPVAGIVGGGHFRRFFPWGDPRLVHPIYNDKLDCFGCNWVCRFESLRCLQELNPSAAAQSLRAAVDAAGAPARQP